MTKADVDARVSSDIASLGWHVIGVLGDEQGPPFAYSIGLFKTFSHPEVIILGLQPKVAMPLVNDLGRAVRGGAIFRHGSVTDELLKGYSCVLVDVLNLPRFGGHLR
jgi:hypothetical protein